MANLLLNPPNYQPHNGRFRAERSRTMNRVSSLLLNRVKDPTLWPAPSDGSVFTPSGRISTIQENGVELSVTFDKDLDAFLGFVCYFISSEAQLGNRDETRVQVRFELRISRAARNFNSLTTRWDNIGF